MPTQFLNAKECALKIVSQVGPEIKVATPLAAGKPNHLLNAIYQLVKADSKLRLTIYTALTLEKPKGAKDFDRRFFGPFAERVFGNYPDLDYELDRVAGKLPANIDVIEFYFPAGKFMNNPAAQQNYISTNYTHVARDLLGRGVNVVLQQVAHRKYPDGEKYSLSCNADVTLDVIRKFHEMKASGQNVIVAGQVNGELPFMFGDALLGPDAFDYIVDDKSEYYTVFGPPKMAVGDAEYMIGLYDSILVRDGGELQIGIGALGDSLTYALLLRHRENDLYRSILNRLVVSEKFTTVVREVGDMGEFGDGLFGATEMVVDGFLHLLKGGVLKRKVYDDLPLQRLLSQRKIHEKITPETVEQLLQVRAIRSPLQKRDFDYLQYWGVFRADIGFESGEIVFADGKRVPGDLESPGSRNVIFDRCLGDKLKNGAVIHGGFFLGPQSYYKALRELPDEQLQLINMRSVTKINQLYGHEEIDRLQRKNARFINTCLKMTLLGSAVSDGLEDGRVISGIGGQYNFVSMAHALPDGRSVLNLRSTRGSGKTLQSNIVWNYGHMSIPRHLRDIVVTEYGIANLRGKTDSEVIGELLNIADSRFQEALLNEAKRNKKIRADYQIPEVFRHNLPESYASVLNEFKKDGHFTRFPFGTDFTQEEIKIGAALKRLKAKTASRSGTVKTLMRALMARDPSAKHTAALERMGLATPKTLAEHFYRRLLLSEFQ